MALGDSVDIIRRSQSYGTMSISDPDVAGFLGIGTSSVSGETITEHTTLSSSAWFRGVSVLANTIASLPLKTYRTSDDMERSQVDSLFDDPCPGFFTPFQWVQILMVHLVLHGNAYLLILRNAAGGMVGLFPIHPTLVTPQWVCDEDNRIVGKRFMTSVSGQTLYYAQDEMIQIMGMGTDGLRGYSLLRLARNAIGVTLAGDHAAGRMFSNGMLIGGLVSTEETMDEEDGKLVMAGLRQKLTGSQNAGDIALVNASLKFTPWTMSAEDGQFIESRQFQVEDASRWLGVPKVLLAEDGASSWGTGIGQLLAFMQKTTFVPWTTLMEQVLSQLLPKPRHVEFLYAGLLKGTPLEETQLLAEQLSAGIISQDEARAILNLPPLDKGPEPDTETVQALSLAQAAPSLLQNPGLVALVNQLRSLNGKPPLPDPAATATPPLGAPVATV